MEPGTPAHESLYVPDRFEGLKDAPEGALRTIVTPVRRALDQIDELASQMKASRRGALMLLRGDTGAGKSTFLDTVGLFRDAVTTVRVPRTQPVGERLAKLGPAEHFRIVVLENREAVGLYSMNAIEADLHAINAFVRSDNGRWTLVVWPVNTDDLLDRLVDIGSKIGGTALFGLDDEVTIFTGPPRDEFVAIASRTVSALNEGASLAALGISDEYANELTGRADTIGSYLGLIRDALLTNEKRVTGLLPVERFRMWTLVITGSETEGDVAALTRGGYAYVDIDRLITSTGANIVQDLKERPDQLGILGTMLDAKIINIDMLTILAIARTYGDDQLHGLMKGRGMSVSPDKQAAERLSASELGLLISGRTLGTRKRGSKPGDNTQAAFAGLADIARNNDAALNRAIGTALLDNGYIDGFETEKALGTNYVVKSDLQVAQGMERIRLEAMWRTKAGRADIANYVLTKLGLYSRAVGLMA
jgi:hypothetical protein